ncbi:hypothetical protein GCM10009838_68080 [Catenulispora subtropica]|uniref:Integrase family protein n=1 Tax=Catenulispora subtropica TaxID=450798 RepID=A0ABN2SXS5_9ACTN
MLDDYTRQLAQAPFSAHTRRTYVSKVRRFLIRLDTCPVGDGDPLGDKRARDWTARDYRTHLLAVVKREPAIVNNALAALDDLYTRRGLGPADAKRAELPETAPRARESRDRLLFLREVERWPNVRDRAIVLVPFYAGARISEVVALDVEDVRMSRRVGELRLYDKGSKVRTVPIRPRPRTALDDGPPTAASRASAQRLRPCRGGWQPGRGSGASGRCRRQGREGLQIPLVDHLEQQRGAVVGQRQVVQFVDDEEPRAGEEPYAG